MQFLESDSLLQTLFSGVCVGSRFSPIALPCGKFCSRDTVQHVLPGVAIIADSIASSGATFSSLMRVGSTSTDMMDAGECFEDQEKDMQMPASHREMGIQARQ